MNLIKQKKINSGLINFFLYLSFCFAGWYSARSSVASVLAGYLSLDFLNNDIFAFIIAGLMPFILYLLIVKFFSFALKKTPNLPVDEMVYALPFFYIGANVVTGLIGIIYFFVPLASFWGGILVPIISTSIFFILYVRFICLNYIKKYNWKVIVMYFGRLYIVITLIFTAWGLLSAVLL